MADPRFSHVGHVSLNALRAFESAARHLSFTTAARELSVTQAAVSHQVKALELRLGVTLFRRTPRGLVVTDEGLSLLPTLNDTFGRPNSLMALFEGGRRQEVLTVGVVGTFALGWLLPRLPDFEALHPFVRLRLLTNNNRVDIAGEGLDYAIRFGDGAWHGTAADLIMAAPMTPLCAPQLARGLHAPGDIRGVPLLRSYRLQDWLAWRAAAGLDDLPIRGPVFDSSSLMAQAAVLGHGVALVPPAMFERELTVGSLVRPFSIEIDTGSYWLARLNTRQPTNAMNRFREWVLGWASGNEIYRDL